MKNHLLLVLLSIASLNTFAQKNNAWKFIDHKSTNSTSKITTTEYSENQKLLEFNPLLFKQLVTNTSNKISGGKGVEILLPNINGDLEKFLVWESSNFEPTLQAKHPDIKAFKGKGITDPTATVNFSFSPAGIQTMVFRAGNVSEYIEPYTKDNSVYVLFDAKTRINNKSQFTCLTPNHEEVISMNKTNPMGKSSNQTYKTLRLALSCTGEYAQYYIGKGMTPLEGMNATVTRVNAIFEHDLALHLIMIDNHLVVYDDPATDPYAAPSAEATQGVWNAQLQNTLDTKIGYNNYDIGHLLAIRSGSAAILGNAGFLAGVCINGQKGSAFSSSTNPEGDTYDVGTVTHEMGHQMGARHIFSHNPEGTGGTQVEPGTGSSIMGYPGTGTLYDVQDHTDPYFNYINISQIQSTLAGRCAVLPAITNTPPTVDAGGNFVVPGGTAYILKGAASDTENDPLTYCWEQNDNATSNEIGANSIASPTKVNGPNYRSFQPTTSPNRYLPRLSDVLVNQLSSKWESVSTIDRTLTFALTVRDNHFNDVDNRTEGLTTSEIITIHSLPVYKVDETTINPLGAGPFTVTSQSSVTNNPKWNKNEIKTIAWDVNNTNNTAIIPGAATVNIKLSIDGGQTFPYILAENTPNDGNEAIIVPATPASLNCRVMVEPTNSIFYAINFRKFSISEGTLANEDFEFSNFSLYPNPNKGSFTLRFDNPSANDITVNAFDLSGRKIFENNFSNQATFNEAILLNNVVQGIYLISVQSGNQKTVKRIMIE